jgi:hypothetical protein
VAAGADGAVSRLLGRFACGDSPVVGAARTAFDGSAVAPISASAQTGIPEAGIVGAPLAMFGCFYVSNLFRLFLDWSIDDSLVITVLQNFGIT